jgi:hypothetical protein
MVLSLTSLIDGNLKIANFVVVDLEIFELVDFITLPNRTIPSFQIALRPRRGVKPNFVRPVFDR